MTDKDNSHFKQTFANIADKLTSIRNTQKMDEWWYTHSTSFFSFPDYKKHFYGLKDASTNTIIFRHKDDVQCNSILSGDSQKYIILDRSFDSPFDYEIGALGTIKCYKAYYDIYTEPKPIEHTQINTTIVSNCTVGGDININTQQIMSDLDKLETGIKNTKVGPLHKKDKEQAMFLCGQFKDCVISKKKDQSLFDSFVKVLGAIAPALVQLATSIFMMI